jgi:hypothetical protein
MAKDLSMYADGYGAAADSQSQHNVPAHLKQTNNPSYTGQVNNMIRALMDGYANNPYGGKATQPPAGPPVSLAAPPQPTAPAWPPAGAAVPYSGSATMGGNPAPTPPPMQPTAGVPYLGGPLNTPPPLTSPY